MNLKNFIFFSLFLFFVSCGTNEPLLNFDKLTISAEDVSSTEVWLKVTANEIPLPAKININIDIDENLEFTLEKNEEILYIDNLQPGTAYSLHATILSEGKIYASESVFLNTLDTTSHNFTWQTWTFGDFASSYFSDVAIIDENNIWAVGEIFLYDSLGNVDPHAYNLAIFDGSEWELKRLYYETSTGSKFLHPIMSIFDFSPDDIWFGNLLHWDGKIYESIPLNINFESNINAIWGTSSEDLYIVGNNGNIAHYNGNEWEKIESGTSLKIRDIWGVNETPIAVTENSLIFFNEDGKTLTPSVSDVFINSLWTKSDYKIFTSGNGIMTYENKKWEVNKEFSGIGVADIKGMDYNNISAAGASGLFAHFNGKSWKAVSTGISNTYIGIAVSKKINVSVGWQGQKGVITIFNKQ